MNIQEFCSHEVATIDVNANALAAAQAMRDRHVGALVVTRGTDSRRQVVGVVTDRDLVIKALAVDAVAVDTPVGGLMCPRIVSVPANASLSDTIGAMRDEGVRRVLVAGEAGGLAGIATMDDLLEAMSVEMADLTGALRAGIERERSIPASARRPLPDDSPSLPGEALAARWRQVTSP